MVDRWGTLGIFLLEGGTGAATSAANSSAQIRQLRKRIESATRSNEKDQPADEYKSEERKSA